jgi:hypothetical protein
MRIGQQSIDRSGAQDRVTLGLADAHGEWSRSLPFPFHFPFAAYHKFKPSARVRMRGGGDAAAADAAREESRAIAQALASRAPVILFFKSRNCSLCRALQDSAADLQAAHNVAIHPITTDDQAAWAPEVSRPPGVLDTRRSPRRSASKTLPPHNKPLTAPFAPIAQPPDAPVRRRDRPVLRRPGLPRPRRRQDRAAPRRGAHAAKPRLARTHDAPPPVADRQQPRLAARSVRPSRHLRHLTEPNSALAEFGAQEDLPLQLTREPREPGACHDLEVHPVCNIPAVASAEREPRARKCVGRGGERGHAGRWPR